MQERLQKILSARGIASRRKAEEYILRGLVKVNGQAATLGQKADPDVDTIEVDGQVLRERQKMLYYLMYKPVGVETTNVERTGKPIVRTIRDLLPPELRGKVFPVGRLDKDSEGLLLLTNDGALAYRLTHPKFDHEKEYEVEVADPVFEGQLRKMREGMTISGEKTKAASVGKTGEKKFTIALTEGKNRQIRRMCQKVGNPVVSLKRVRIMTLADSSLAAGHIRELDAGERMSLLRAVGIESSGCQ
ncbi:MAG: 23S rRNA pseudouridine synthase [Candidatus Peregrinibacteria bacterium Greene0416_19]|nr:MAG: 23S rRNA pseudouridine synthase [Candidatus Peregrinibacteria bacterium Greene0416_19]